MKNQQSKSNLLPILLGAGGLALLLLLAGFGYMVYAMTQQSKQTEQLGSAIVALNEQIKTAPKAPSGEEFQNAVASAIENIVQTQQRDIAKAKLAKYDNALEQVADGKHIYGSLNARFTLVEWSDFECPYCKRFHNTPKQLVDESNGNVNWQWKHLPLSFHNPAALDLAVAAECVAELGGNKKFWVFTEDVFKFTRGNGQGIQNMSTIAAEVGVDESQFNECVQSGRHRAKVESDMNQAAKMGIKGTPATFVVDNTTGKSVLLGGAQPAEAFVAAMRKMMAEEQENKAQSSASDQK